MNNQNVMVHRKDADKLIMVQKYEETSEDMIVKKQDNKMIAVSDYSKIVNTDTQKTMVPRNVKQPEKQLQIENTEDINNLDNVQAKSLDNADSKNIVPDNKSTDDVRAIINRQQEAVKQQMTGETVINVDKSNQNQQINQQAAQNTTQTNTNNQSQQVGQSVNETQKKIVLQMRTIMSIDDLVAMYIKMFEEHFDIKLSPSICFENMRKLCDIDVKMPEKCLYTLENTYRLSTIMYLTEHLPIIIVASILAEKNRKNILNYVTSEVEIASKKIDDLIALRTKRWYEKYKTMNINDAMTVTPGVTNISPDIMALMCKNFDHMCNNLKKFNKELSDIVSKFDNNTRNDVIFIYSNWWYLLQGFENEPNMRAYIMSITDDTRKNLKI